MGKTRQRQFAAIDSGEWVEASGIVIKLLKDDNEGSRHQRFIVDLRNDQTLLIAHNIDLAPRIPLAVGDRLKFRGMYESNDLGERCDEAQPLNPVIARNVVTRQSSFS